MASSPHSAARRPGDPRRASHKALVWLPFAAGGMLAAFIVPVMVLLTTGAVMPNALSYERAHAFADNYLGKAVLFGMLVALMWHAAHRLRITAHDFGVRNDFLIRHTCYWLAGLGSLLALIFLLAI